MMNRQFSLSHYLSILLGIGTLILIVLTLSLHKPAEATLKTSVILESSQVPSHTYTLIYNNPTLSEVVGYDFSPMSPDAQLTRSSKKFTPYTEGYLPSEVTGLIVELIKKNNPLIGDYFHDYYFHDGISYIAFSGGLDQIFAVDIEQNTVSSLQYAPSEDLGDMYVSSMQVVNDQLIIVGAEAHTYNLLVYTFDTSTHQLTSHAKLAAPSKVMNADHLFVSPSGILYFLGEGNTVMAYDPFSQSLESIATANSGDFLLPYQDSFMTISHDDAIISVDSPNFESPLNFSLPTPSVLPITYRYDDDYLVGIFFDGQGRQFSHYVSIYHLPSGSWSYLLGIQPHETLSLTDFVIDVQSPHTN